MKTSNFVISIYNREKPSCVQKEQIAENLKEGGSDLSVEPIILDPKNPLNIEGENYDELFDEIQT